MREILVQDPDHFVRRTAAKSLASYPSVATATALVDYLERTVAELDGKGSEFAQESLAVLAGKSGHRTVAAWRTWLEQYSRSGGR